MIEHQASALRDRYAAILRDSLQVLDEETVAQWLHDLETEIHAPDSPVEDRLAANAELVGVLTVMLEGIDASKGNL